MKITEQSLLEIQKAIIYIELQKTQLTNNTSKSENNYNEHVHIFLTNLVI